MGIGMETIIELKAILGFFLGFIMCSIFIWLVVVIVDFISYYLVGAITDGKEEKSVKQKKSDIKNKV